MRILLLLLLTCCSISCAYFHKMDKQDKFVLPMLLPQKDLSIDQEQEMKLIMPLEKRDGTLDTMQVKIIILHWNSHNKVKHTPEEIDKITDSTLSIISKMNKEYREKQKQDDKEAKWKESHKLT